ncbi:MAG: formate--tetrahydrofolate ligase [Candidatus Thermoplasmatota archaeon]|nr:formate--tetrahydrofolate ligase [Candidatus Thermoplasmatota archaeon]
MEPDKLMKIENVASQIGISRDEIEPYGDYMAKINFMKLNTKKVQGKLVLVTAMTPTKYGEGKTTTVIGISQALHSMGKKVSISIREPSMGPCFGVKGGATGGGKATVEPSDRINLLFTGDFPAITAAHNLLSALINNHIFHGNQLKINPEKIVFPRTIDMNDRSLRNIIVGVTQGEGGILARDSFVITPASEIMAIVGLSDSYGDLKRRLARILVGYTFDNKPVYSGDLKAHGAMAAILVDALKPNLVQAKGGVPAFIHTGPFGNIAHGTSSLIAARTALATSDIVLTEAGFGSDLGAEKFMNLVSRVGDIPISAVVIVATIRAMKLHGGNDKSDVEDVDAVKKGFNNLMFHVENIRKFGFEPVVALNRFPDDTENEIDQVETLLKKNSIAYGLSEVFEKGAEGGKEVADLLLKRMPENPISVKYTYSMDQTLTEKIENIGKKIYGAKEVIYTRTAQSNIKKIEKLGYGKLPICMAKTQYSISDDPLKLNAPEDFSITVTSVALSSGAEFVVVYLGSVMTMPGLPKEPASNGIDINENGIITGLF